jgi:hypothetical protein
MDLKKKTRPGVRRVRVDRVWRNGAFEVLYPQQAQSALFDLFVRLALVLDSCSHCSASPGIYEHIYSTGTEPIFQDARAELPRMNLDKGQFNVLTLVC